MSDKLLSRFLRYVRVDTQSDETSAAFPSTPGQLVLLEMLKQELSELGAADVQMTKHGYVMASIPANTRKARVPTVAFLAHVDTAPDCSCKNVKPIVHRKYDGRVIKFPDKPGLTLDPATSPELRTAVGKDIVTASGTTLLGSDDKSGVAVVMTLVERLLRRQSGSIGLIRVCFTPDEEIGRGVNKLICECSGRMLLTPWTAVRRGRFAGKPFRRCGRGHHRWHHHSYHGGAGPKVW
jgi:tripeptide aminopeptidase